MIEINKIYKPYRRKKVVTQIYFSPAFSAGTCIRWIKYKGIKNAVLCDPTKRPWKKQPRIKLIAQITEKFL